MMKITYSTDNINSFGGINFAESITINTSVYRAIDQTLGGRGINAMYAYGDLFRFYLLIVLFGGECAEDITEYLRGELMQVKGFNVCSADTLLRMQKEPATGKERTVSGTGIEHDFNTNMEKNRLMVKLLIHLKQLSTDDKGYVFDYDNQFIPTDKYDSKRSYKHADGHFPGIASIEINFFERFLLLFLKNILNPYYMSMSVKQEEFDRQLDLNQIRNFRKTGNLELLEKLYYKYMPLVYGLGLKYLKDRTIAQNMVMQVFEKLTVELVNHEIKNFRNWLYVESKNQCITELRRRNADEKQFKNWKEEQKKIMENGVELHPLDKDVRMTNALKNCLTKLKEEQKICIEQFYFEKKCYQEIAGVLKVGEKEVKSYIQTGKRNLKICLESNHVRI